MKAKPLAQYMQDNGLSDHAFLNRVLEHIENHPLFEHRFFKAFASGKLTLDHVKVWAKQRVVSSQDFPCFLGAFVSHLRGRQLREVRAAYVKQGWEEHGEGDPQKIHSFQLERFIFALGVGRRELEQRVILPGTRRFVDTYMNISREGNLLECMGMYALGSEPVIAMEMVLCLQGIAATLPWLDPQDSVYFSDHAYHDYRHTAELVQILLPYLKTRADEERAWEGVIQIVDARKGLYDGIAEAIGI